MADDHGDPPSQVAELELRLESFDTQEQLLREQLAKTNRSLAIQRAASRPPLMPLGPFGWGASMFFVGLVGSLLCRC
jgi:hypothetical protein